MVRTEALEAPKTRRLDRHHLPPIRGAGPRGPAPGGRKSPRFPRWPSERGRQRSTRAPTRKQTVHPASPPPPSPRHGPVHCRGDGTPRTRGQAEPQQTSNPDGGLGNQPLKAPPLPHAGRDSTSPGHGHRPPSQPGPCATGLPTLWRSQATWTRRTRHYSGGTTQATRERTKK